MELQEYKCACGCGKKWRSTTGNRTFYNEWCAKKAGSTVPEPKRPTRVPAKPRPGGDVDVEWARLVKAARERLSSINKARMEVADYALEACTIRHGGGGHWNNFEGQTTLRRFAEEIGMSYKTLHTWVQIRKCVIAKLGHGEYDERLYGAAMRTLDRLGGEKKGDKANASPDNVRKIYDEEKNRKGDKHHILEAIANLKTVNNKFKNNLIDISKCRAEEVNELAHLCALIAKALRAQGYDRALLANVGT